MKLRSDSWIIIERAHANGNFRAVRPIAAKQARTAIHAKCFHRAFVFSVNPDQLSALQQAKLLPLYASLRANCRPRVLATALAMTMTRADKWWHDLETHSAAEATASNDLVHERA